MAEEPPAGRRELEALDRRVSFIDEHGTRGTVAAVGLVQAQLSEVIKDMGKLEGRLDAHDGRHDREAAAAAAGRRWIVGTVIAVLCLLVAILAAVLPLAFRA